MHLNICVETNKMRQFSIQSNGQNVSGEDGSVLNNSTYFRPRKVLWGGVGGGYSLFYHKGPGVVIDPRALKDTVQPNYPTFQLHCIVEAGAHPPPVHKKSSGKAHKRGRICLVREWNGME